ncbi:hypothetical protein LJ655_02575 [Paraburkholderia sp. MMS20-SJTN17]|uniref:Lhr-like DEAD/H associated domain-containing protein n=1 Tax=Paraburkholderia translucens TaxID=2886945 RepID=A0ABS8K7R9_9BURK|nr:hypothetical protein [Paraburkholderia sp. MMS20-SJTN17]MCC8400790.1 hypothetical protein [Paraburkholderia sp. MMS20-SJTN17]
MPPVVARRSGTLLNRHAAKGVRRAGAASRHHCDWPWFRCIRAARLSSAYLCIARSGHARRNAPGTLSISLYDYDSGSLCAQAFDWDARLQNDLPSPKELDHDILASFDSSELSLRRFRAIAPVSRLVFRVHPGRRKPRSNCRYRQARL